MTDSHAAPPLMQDPLDPFRVEFCEGETLGDFPTFEAAERFARQVAIVHRQRVAIQHVDGTAAEIVPRAGGRPWTDLTMIGARFA